MSVKLLLAVFFWIMTLLFAIEADWILCGIAALLWLGFWLADILNEGAEWHN